MIRIATPPRTFEATTATLRFGSVAYEAEPTASGGYSSGERLATDKPRSRVVLCIGLSYTSGQRG